MLVFAADPARPANRTMKKTTIGLLHPGAMGSTLGKSAVDTGHRVLWLSAGRSEQSRQRADSAGLQAIESMAEMCSQADHIFSVCPPDAAIDLANGVAANGFKGIFTDANAISPASAKAVQDIIESHGASFVDGGIIGPPAQRSGSTRLYLSGAAAPKVAPLLSDGLLPAIAIGDQAGQASALKMAYAAYTKGHSALLLAARALARGQGVEDALLAEWDLSQPQLQEKCASEGSVAAKKGWRFAGEMREIASTMEATGLPAGFHAAAADLYQRCESFKDGESLPAIDDVIDQLLKKG